MKSCVSISFFVCCFSAAVVLTNEKKKISMGNKINIINEAVFGFQRSALVFSDMASWFHARPTVSKWLRRCSRRVKRLLQAWQGYGLSPVWQRKWRFRSAFLFTVCVQKGHLKRIMEFESASEGLVYQYFCDELLTRWKYF